MKKNTRIAIVVAVITILATALFIRMETMSDVFVWKGAKVWVDVCYPTGADIKVSKCEDYIYGDTCVNPDILFRFNSDTPMKIYFELHSTGVYSITDGNGYKDFLVTRRSPDRHEYFGCESESGCYDQKEQRSSFNLEECK